MKKIFLLQLILIPVLTFGQLTVKSFGISATDLSFDPVSDKLYMTLPSTYGSNGNSIGIFNYHTMTLEKTVFVGSEPSKMAVSGDGKYIYTAFNGSSTVRRFNIQQQTADIQFPLGSDTNFGAYYAYDLTVMPGNSNSVAVSRITKNSPAYYGVAVYDNGVARPVSTIFNVPNKNSYVVRFINDSTILGYNNQSAAYELNKIRVKSTGCADFLNIGNLLNNPSISNFEISADRKSVFFDFGAAIDISGSSPYVIGTFNGAEGHVAYDKTANIVCYAIGTGNGTPVFKRYNPQTFLLIDNTTAGTANETVLKAIVCKNGYYAFITNNNLYVLYDITLGTNNTAKTKQIAMYQAGSELKIQNANINSVSITDMRGVTMIQENSFKGSINIGNLPSGMYVVQSVDSDKNLYRNVFMKK